jgi:hypothetical protein
MRWTTGSPSMLEWREVAVLATAAGLVVETVRGPRPLEYFSGAEWGEFVSEYVYTIPKLEDNMTEKKKRAPRKNYAAIEERLHSVGDAIDKAIGYLSDEATGDAKRTLEWAKVIADGGDLEAWYRKELGL